MKKYHLAAIGLTLLAGGCATHNWAPAPGKDPNQFTSDKARCSLMARHANNGGVYAYGSEEFVAGAMVGNAIGNAIGANQDFNDCMQAVGWEIADDERSAPVAYTPVYTPPPPPPAPQSSPAEGDPADGWYDPAASAPPPPPAPAAPPTGIRPGRTIPYPE